MSADNYMLIRKYKKQYAVTMEFASAPCPVDLAWAVKTKRAAMFDTHDEALTYAMSQWTEYGVSDETLGGNEYQAVLHIAVDEEMLSGDESIENVARIVNERLPDGMSVRPLSEVLSC